MKRTAFATALLLGLAACGGSDSPDTGAPAATDAPAPAEAPAAAASDALTVPSWYTQDGNNVTLEIVAGQTDRGNYWNYNGSMFGEMTIVVPEGANVTLNFSNKDPYMAHSVGVSPGFNTAPAVVDPTPVFEGAISTNPTSMTEGTMPGQSETINFVAATAGDYVLVCYVAGHAVSGMWVHFVVSADGEAGVRGA